MKFSSRMGRFGIKNRRISSTTPTTTTKEQEKDVLDQERWTAEIERGGDIEVENVEDDAGFVMTMEGKSRTSGKALSGTLLAFLCSTCGLSALSSCVNKGFAF